MKSPISGPVRAQGFQASAAERLALPMVLVSMPFVDYRRPSIQLGLLKAVAVKEGFSVRTLHANLDCAKQLGAEVYRVLSEHRGPLIGDWLFSIEAFGDAAPDQDGHLLDEFSSVLSELPGAPEDWKALLLRIREHEVPAYLDKLVATGPWQHARVVGFSSTFQQTAASIALARRLKREHPRIVTVFGGANFDGSMGLELVRAVRSIDYAIIGEGDRALPRLLDALASGADVDRVPGVARRGDAAVIHTRPAPHAQDLDDLPAPDYDEYFEHAEELGLLSAVERRNIWLPIETARGCWWGQKHHCTFCGLNGTAMEFRSKSGAHVLSELAAQARRYRSFRFEAVDNILDLAFLRQLLPQLVQSRADYEIFYEVKANLTRPQLKLMADAGLRHIQPGLESLSSHVLHLMRKGVRASQNVNLLRWCKYYGIEVAWNILWGFPGETEQDYVEQATVVPHLVHLQPPSAANRIWLERFSPLYSDPDLFPVRSRTPERSYRHIYPAELDLDQLAYFFDYEPEGALPASTYAGLSEAVAGWSALWKQAAPPALTYWSSPGFLQIYDARHVGQEGTYTFEGVLAAVYLACSDRPTGASAVRQQLGLELPIEVIEEIFVEYQQRGLMLIDGTSALSLALPAVTGR